MYAHQYHANIRHLAEPEFGRAKRIRIWVNGDVYNNSYEICLNPNRLRTWNSILLHITNILQTNFGAVRNIVSVKTKKCVKCFADLENNGKYIAVGFVNSIKFEKHRYKTVTKNDSKKKSVKKFYSGDLDAKEQEFWVETKKRKLTVIFILVNGRQYQSPTKVVLTETDLLMWDVVLEFLSKMLDVPDGIQYIYTIFGDIIYDPPEELQHGCLYVAVAFNEKYEKMDYIGLFNEWEPTRKNGYLLGIRPATAASARLPVRKKGVTKIDISQERAEEDPKESVTNDGKVLKKNEGNDITGDDKEQYLSDINEDETEIENINQRNGNVSVATGGVLKEEKASQNYVPVADQLVPVEEDTHTYQIPKNYVASSKSKENSENISEFVSRMEAIGSTSKVEDMQDNKTLVLKNQASEVISTKLVNENLSTTYSYSEKAVQTTIPDNTAENNVNVCCSIEVISPCNSIDGAKCMRDIESASLDTTVENAIVEETSEVDSEKSKCMEELLDEIAYRIYGITEKAIAESSNNEDVDNTNNINSDTIETDLKDENKKENLNDVEKKPFTKLNGNESSNGGITAALSEDDLCTTDKAIHIRNRTDINFCDASKPKSCCQVFKEEVDKKIYDKNISSANNTCCSSSETMKREPKDMKCCFCYSGNKQKKNVPTCISEKSEDENSLKNNHCLYNKIFVGFIDSELRNKNARVFCSCSNISVDSIEEDSSECH